MTNVRVRFAPSPTGPLHIGGIRTALYNFLYAKKHGGTFILRIEDTDQNRFVDGAEAYILDSLKWCGLIPEEGPDQGGPHKPYRQSERKDIYQKYVQKLIANERAYYAFDTIDELEAMRGAENDHIKYDSTTRMNMHNSLSLTPEMTEKLISEGLPYVVRLLIPENRKITFTDRIRGDVTFDTKELDDKIILKADGLPTYHLANVVDDYLMEITHVIRGEEWLSSTAHHVLLYEAFGWQTVMPEFAHLPLILKPSGKGKLSKRDGQKFGFPVFPLQWIDDDPAESFEGFKSVGFHPAALVNFLAFLGWNPGTEQEIFSLEELVEAFSIEQIGKSGARFDFDKALWYNMQYISNQNLDELTEQIQPFMLKSGIKVSDQELRPIVSLMRDRIKTYSEMPVASAFFFKPVEEIDTTTIRKKWNLAIKNRYQTFISQLDALNDFRAPTIKDVINLFIVENQLKFGDFLPLLRIALSGDSKGPDLFMLMEILGQEVCVKRLREAVNVFDDVTPSNDQP